MFDFSVIPDRSNKHQDLIGVNVNHTGRVTYSYPTVFVTACSMDMYYFPYDRHSCSLRFTPVGGEADELELTTFKDQIDLT